MRAALLKKYASEGSVQIDMVDVPEPSVNQVQVEVYAASANPFDYKVRDGLMKQTMPLELPIILGGDVAGIITALGEGATDFSIGDKIYGQANATKQGSFAEYTIVDISQMALMPKTDYLTAAALPLVACSAYQALSHLEVKPHQNILIHGGAGGIGAMAIQIAKYFGLNITTTVSQNDKAYVKSLGADLAIDYHKEDFTKLVKDYDYVFDLVGGQSFTKSYEVLKTGGKIISMVNETNPQLDAKFQVTSMHQFAQVSTKKLNFITELVNQHKLSVNIDRQFNLAETSLALDYLKNDHPKGKVVIQVKA